jgi:Uma2 family endonuclease
MNLTLTKIESDTWVNATWEEYLQIEENPDYQTAKTYYYQGKIRIEMSPLGNDHASDHSVIITGINLYNILKNINFNCKDNCTYRKTGYQAVQPDLSYYLGKNVNAIPYGTGVVNLDIYPAPNLVIEIANSSLLDDLGTKRLLYENLGSQEYWIVDVQNQTIIAFRINDGGSQQIRISEVLQGLNIDILEEALRKTRQENQNHNLVGAWLLQQFN